MSPISLGLAVTFWSVFQRWGKAVRIPFPQASCRAEQHIPGARVNVQLSACRIHWRSVSAATLSTQAFLPRKKVCIKPGSVHGDRSPSHTLSCRRPKHSISGTRCHSALRAHEDGPLLPGRRIHVSREPDSGRAGGRGTTTFMTLTCLVPAGRMRLRYGAMTAPSSSPTR
jgi:hypothetical protein